MQPESDHAKTIFLRAIEGQSPEKWEAYLDGACGDDAPLRSRVSALLQAHQEMGSFREEAPAVARTIDMPAEPRVAAAPGTVIGPYKLLQQIGEGGMGVVYMAEQAAPVRRKVALKIIKPGMDTREVIARFEAERQALALMDHPNIARVFDAGATDTGRPYFVMELVRGVPITDYCDQNNLPVHERLELFVTVCHAVQHAHQKGIIHRDIKPSNVLVTLHDGRPVPKVIDFGVAKAIGQQLTDKTLFTQFAQMVGTPLYMSPEQAELTGLDIDTRGDIYSLGVMLYELLTGTTPFEGGRMKKAALDEIRRMIREEDPPSPSMRLSSTAGEAQTAVAAHRHIDPKGLSRLVRGDLDWIVMKALEKDRTRRYETANGFAADIVRYLSDEPVEACPPSSTYRFRKFARRNRVAFSTAALVLAALVVGTVVSTWQAFRATHAEGLADERLETANANYDTAEAERRRAEASEQDAKTKEGLAQDARKEAVESLKEALAAVDQMLTRVGQERLDSVPQMEPVRRELLQDALTFYQRFLQNNRNDPMVRRETALAYRRLAEIQRNLGQFAESEQNYGIFFAIFEEPQAGSALEPSVRRELGWAHLHLAACLGELDKREEQEQQIRQAVVIAEDLTKEFPQDANYGDLLGQATFWKAALISATQPEEAEKLLRRSLTLTNSPWQLMDGYRVLGELLAKHGRSSEAEQALRQSVAACEQFALERPLSNWVQGNRGATLHLLSDVVAATGRLEEAEEISDQSIAILDKLAVEFSEGPDYRNRQAWAYQKRALLLRKLNRTADAEQAYRRALELFVKLAADFPTIRAYPQNAFDQRLSLGQFIVEAGRPDDALEIYRQAADLPQNLAANAATKLNHWQGLVRTHIELARLLAKSGKTEESETAYRRAEEIQEKLEKDFADKPDERLDLARSHFQAANLFRDAGRPADDEKFSRLAISNLEKLTADFPDVPDYRYELAVRINWLGGPLDVMGRKSEAEACNVKTAAILEQLVAEHPAVPTYRHFQAWNFQCLADHQTRTGRFAEAERSHRAAIDLWEKLAVDSPGEPASRAEIGWTCRKLASLLARQPNQGPEAEEMHRRDIDVFETLSAKFRDKTDWPEHLAHGHRQWGFDLWETGRPQEGAKAFREAINVLEKSTADFPNAVPSHHSLLSDTYGRLASLLATTGDPQESEQAIREVVKVLEKHAAADPGAHAYRRGIAMAHNGLGALFQTGGRIPEAERSYRAAIDLCETLAAEFPDDRQYRRELGRCRNSLGILLAKSGRFDDAEQAHQQALDLYQRLVQEVDPTVGHLHRRELAWTYMNLGSLLHKCRRMADAEKAFREAIAVLEKLDTEFPTQGYAGWLANGYTDLALVLSAAGQTQEADQAYRKVLELKPESAPAMNNLAWLLATCEEPGFRNPARAVELASKAVELAPKERGHWNTLGVAQYRAGDWKAAIEALEKSAALSEGGDSFDWFFLAMADWQSNDKEEARKKFDQAVTWMEKNQPQNEELQRFRAEAEELLK